jgi:MFS family permease
LAGGVLFGIAGDRLGAKRVLVFGLLVQAIAALGYLLVSSLASFYTVAALFGFIYAGTMPLYSVIARENFPLKMMGTVIGGTAMAGGLGMATGPVFGGLIYDKTGSYSWLFMSSFALAPSSSRSRFGHSHPRISGLLRRKTFGGPVPKGKRAALHDCFWLKADLPWLSG